MSDLSDFIYNPAGAGTQIYRDVGSVCLSPIKADDLDGGKLVRMRDVVLNRITYPELDVEITYDDIEFTNEKKDVGNGSVFDGVFMSGVIRNGSTIVISGLFRNATGDFGRILVSEDSGASWNMYNKGTTFVPYSTTGNKNSFYDTFHSRWVIFGNNSGSDRLVSYTTDVTQWPIYSTSGITSNINAISDDSSGNYVAVGDSGGIYYSSTLTNWTVATTSSFGANHVYSVAHDGSSRWVAVGQNGTLESSTDGGDTWASYDSKFGTLDIWSVHYDNSVWVAVGENGRVSTSTDGTTWTLDTDYYNATGNELVTVTYQNSLWIAAGRASGGLEGPLMTSTTPATSWTTRNSNWDDSPADEHIYGVIHDGNQYLAVGGILQASSSSNCMATSQDAINWINQGAYAGFRQGIGFNGTDTWMVTANSVTGGIGIAISNDPDLEHWQLVDFGGGVQANDIHYDAGTWVIAVNGSVGVSHSTNGINWSAVSLDHTNPAHSVYYGGGKWIVGAQGGKLSYASSPSGPWTACTTANTGTIAALAHDGSGRWVASGNVLETSTDGITFSAVTATPEETITGVKYADSKWIGVDQNNIITSTDGLTWTSVSHSLTGTLGSLFDIDYGDGVWVIAATGGYATSTDGINWHPVAVSNFAGTDPGQIVYGDGKFLVSKYGSSDSGVQVLTGLGFNPTTEIFFPEVEIKAEGSGFKRLYPYVKVLPN